MRRAHEKLSSLGAWSNASTRLHVVGPAAGGRDALLNHDLFVVTEMSHHESVPSSVSQRRPHCTEFPPECEQTPRNRPNPLLARRLRCERRMTIRVRALTLTVLALLLATPLLSIAAESIPNGPRRPIRSTDRRLRMLLDDGLRSSPTLARARRAPVRVRCRRLSALRRHDRARRRRPAHVRLVGRSGFATSSCGWRACRARSRSRSWRTNCSTRSRSPTRRRSSMASRWSREYHRIGYVNADSGAARHRVRHRGSGPRR